MALPMVHLAVHTPPTPDEPDPGAYQIGKATAVRPYHVEDDIRWFGFTENGGRTWYSFEDLWDVYGGPDVPIVKLVPERAPDSGPLGTRPNGTVPPYPYPGDEVAVRLPGGGWRIRDVDSHLDAMPKHIEAAYEHWCEGRIDAKATGPTAWYCTEDGREKHGWHIAVYLDHAIAVWPVKES